MEYIPLILQRYHVPTAIAGPWTAGQTTLYLCTHTQAHTERYLGDHDEKQSPLVLPMGNASCGCHPSPGLGVPGKAYVK